jgi:hypothetical protein
MNDTENKKGSLGLLTGLILGFFAGFLVSRNKETAKEIEQGIGRVKEEAGRFFTSVFDQLIDEPIAEKEKTTKSTKKKKNVVN